MSLVGSLEDLGLGDILQIIQLSRKSGVLALRSEAGEGRILFREGLVHAAYLKEGPTDLRELLAARGALDPTALASASEDARARGLALAELLPERGLLASDALDALRREHVESVVIGMFSWPSGEFSFEVREVEACGGDELFAAAGLNPQFLALEGSRQLDEIEREGAAEGALAEPIVEGEELPGELSGEGGPGAAWQAAEPEAPLSEAEGFDPSPEAGGRGPAEAAPAAASSPSALVSQPRAAGSERPPVVVIERELPVLEWIKAALRPDHPRVHVFQHPDQGIQRVRQYLARGEIPLVLLTADAPPDPLSGARDAAEMVQRLKGHAAHMPVIVLLEPGAAPSRALRRARPDGFVGRPSANQLLDRTAGSKREESAAALCDAIARLRGARSERRAAAAPGKPSEALTRLRKVSALIRDPATRGNVLAHVLGFASEHFARAALFMVREGRAIGIAQAGLARAGGPADPALRQLEVPCSEPAWFRSVLATRAPRCAAPSDEGDRRLSALLGQQLPEQAYVAPIESGGEVVALLYADNLPENAPLGDPGAVEVVLHEAGLALDRATLERALEEALG